MTAHDPLCRAKHMDVATEWDDLGGCDCPVIAHVRTDEREQIKWEDDNSLRMVMASHDALLAHAEAVAALREELERHPDGWEIEVAKKQERERIAQAIEAERIDLTGVIAPGELWIDGRLRLILHETEYRMVNAVRDMDAAIAREEQS